MHKLSPILWTKDLGETIQFYETILGFKGRSTFPQFVSLTKGPVEVMFVVPEHEREDGEAGGSAGDQATHPLPGSLYFFMEDVAGFWHSVKDHVKVKYALQDRQYLMRDFSIEDNNGYELVFGEDISTKSI